MRTSTRTRSETTRRRQGAQEKTSAPAKDANTTKEATKNGRGGARAKNSAPAGTPKDGFEKTKSAATPQRRYAASSENVFGVQPEGAKSEGPTAAGAKTFAGSSREAVAESIATPEVKATVSHQLAGVEARLDAGDLTPDVAVEQTKIWNDHLADSAKSVSEAQITRAEEIEQMNPLERAGSFAVGVGVGALKTAKGLADVAQAAHELNPIGMASDVVSDTFAKTVQTGDLAGSLMSAADEQMADTRQAVQNTVDAGRAVAQLANDVVEVVGAPTGVIADGAVNGIVTGDIPGSFADAAQDRRRRAAESGQRLLSVAGEMTGISGLVSGDPRKAGEGAFNLAMTLAPMAKNPSAASRATVANNIVPFKRPPAAGVLAKPKPTVGIPGATAVLDDATATATKARSAAGGPTGLPPVKAPPAAPSGGGRPPWNSMLNGGARNPVGGRRLLAEEFRATRVEVANQKQR